MLMSEEPVDVLIAEDDDTLRESYCLLLQAHGLSCIVAASGSEAIELARSRRPRCVLLDLDLPDLDGYSVARALRADPRTSAMHIHCVSGLSDDNSRRRASQSGCELYLTKPVAVAALLEAVGADSRQGHRGLATRAGVGQEKANRRQAMSQFDFSSSCRDNHDRGLGNHLNGETAQTLNLEWFAAIAGERDQELVFIHPVQVVTEAGEELPPLSCALSAGGIRLLGTRSLLGQKVLVRLAAAGGAGPWDLQVRILWSCPIGDLFVENGGMFLADGGR